MALETERRSPEDAASPGSSDSGCGPEEGSSQRRPSAFHKIELLCEKKPSGTSPSPHHHHHHHHHHHQTLPRIGLLPRVPIIPPSIPSPQSTTPCNKEPLSPLPREVNVQPPPQVPTSPSTLPFSVDNILRPEFGLKASQPRSLPSPPDHSSNGIILHNGNPPPPPPPHQSPPTPVRRRPPDDEYPDPAKIDPPIPDDPSSQIWPAWVYCTRYSDRPSSGPRYRRKAGHSGDSEGPRSRRIKKKDKSKEDKRPRTAFSGEQLARLKSEFTVNRYLTERRRQALASELGLNEAQIKIWFQNKRAKIKKASGSRNPLALQLMAQGLYNHSTVPMSDEESEECSKH